MLGNLKKFLKGRGSKENSITLLVVGLDNSGKTTIVKAIAGESAIETVPTVGFERPITVKKFGASLTLYDLGGGKRIRDVWQHYYNSVHGLVYVVDSADQSKVEETKTEFRKLQELPHVAGKPILVFANKEDLPGHLSEVEVATHLDLDKLQSSPHSIRTCIALPNLAPQKTLDARIEDGLNWLVDVIMKDYNKYSERVKKEMKEQKDAEDKRREEVKERIQREKEKREKGEGNDSDAQKKEENKTDVILCSECKTEPAAKRCAAAKWEAVCEPCADKLEKAAAESAEKEESTKNAESSQEPCGNEPAEAEGEDMADRLKELPDAEEPENGSSDAQKSVESTKNGAKTNEEKGKGKGKGSDDSANDKGTEVGIDKSCEQKEGQQNKYGSPLANKEECDKERRSSLSRGASSKLLRRLSSSLKKNNKVGISNESSENQDSSPRTAQEAE